MVDAALIESLQLRWVADYEVTERIAHKLSRSMIEIGFKCEELPPVIAEITRATMEGDAKALCEAVGKYRQLLWELNAFRYIEYGLRGANKLLAGKLTDDDESIPESPLGS